MLLTIFCCISTGLVVFCVLKRFNQREVQLAVHAAVHEVKKDFYERNKTMVAQLAAKEVALAKARGLVELHEAVPSAPLAAAKPPGSAREAAKEAKEATKAAARKQGLDMFAMSRPFTDTSYDAMMAVSDVVRVEAAAGS